MYICDNMEATEEGSSRNIFYIYNMPNIKYIYKVVILNTHFQTRFHILSLSIYFLLFTLLLNLPGGGGGVIFLGDNLPWGSFPGDNFPRGNFPRTVKTN